MKMKPLFALLTLLSVTVPLTGCGGGPEVDEDASAEAKKLEESPEYEKQMMGEMGGGSGN